MIEYGTVSNADTPAGELAAKIDSATGERTVYSYDARGNLLAVTLVDGTQIEYVVDGRNRRIGKQVNGALVEGLLDRGRLGPVAELDVSGNVVARFVYGTMPHVPDSMSKDGTTNRIITDHLGSVRLVVNAETGALAQRMDYDAFGNVVLDSNSRFQPIGFAGGVDDPDTSLTRFGTRDDDPKIDRWTTKEPLPESNGETNLYAYAAGDPVNLIGPSGLDAFTIEDGVHWGVAVELDDETAADDIRCEDGGLRMAILHPRFSGMQTSAKFFSLTARSRRLK